MDSVGQVDALAARVVGVVAVALLGNGVPGTRVLDARALDSAREAHKWLKANMKDRGREALEDFEQKPESDDNQADLRKQLTRLLDAQPSAASELNAIIPESLAVQHADTVIANVGAALRTANVAVGIFNRRRD
jgi:hypothetical protein